MPTSQKVSKSKISIQNFLTPRPIHLTTNDTLAEAEGIMEQFGIRHIPVLEDDYLVGILSDRDILRAEAEGLASSTRVSIAMTRDPYTVEGNAPLSDVLRTMAAHRLGCVVVRGSGKPIDGIFTTTDALSILADQLEK